MMAVSKLMYYVQVHDTFDILNCNTNICAYIMI